MPLVERTLSGEPTHMDDIMLIVEREELAPEAHHAFYYTPARDEDGTVRGVFCACSETTEQVLAARRQTFRLELDDALRVLESGDTIIHTAAAALGQFLGANRVGYGEADPDAGTISLTTAYLDGVAAVDGTFALVAFGETWANATAMGKTVANRGDAGSRERRSRRVDGHRDARLRLRADPAGGPAQGDVLRQPGHAAPLVGRGRDLIEEVASRVNDTVERVRAEHEARTNEARFRTLTQAIPNQVLTAKPNGVLDWANDRTFAYGGATEITFAGLGWTSIAKVDGRAVRPTVAALVRGTTPFTFVLNQTQPGIRTGRSSEMEAGLEASGRLAQPWISRLVDYQDAYAAGKGRHRIRSPRPCRRGDATALELDEETRKGKLAR